MVLKVLKICPQLVLAGHEIFMKMGHLTFSIQLLMYRHQVWKKKLLGGANETLGPPVPAPDLSGSGGANGTCSTE